MLPELEPRHGRINRNSSVRSLVHRRRGQLCTVSINFFNLKKPAISPVFSFSVVSVDRIWITYFAPSLTRDDVTKDTAVISSECYLVIHDWNCFNPAYLHLRRHWRHVVVVVEWEWRFTLPAAAPTTHTASCQRILKCIYCRQVLNSDSGTWKNTYIKLLKINQGLSRSVCTYLGSA